MVRVRSPMSVMDGRGEVSSLRKQLRHQQQAHRELQTMLQNQPLAIEIFQSKWQMAEMAGQEAHTFLARTRALSEDFKSVQSLPWSSVLRIICSVNTMVNSDHMLMNYKTNIENILARRRIRCRGSSMPHSTIQRVSRLTATNLTTSCLSGGVCRCRIPLRNGSAEISYCTTS